MLLCGMKWPIVQSGILLDWAYGSIVGARLENSRVKFMSCSCETHERKSAGHAMICQSFHLTHIGKCSGVCVDWVFAFFRMAQHVIWSIEVKYCSLLDVICIFRVRYKLINQILSRSCCDSRRAHRHTQTHTFAEGKHILNGRHGS